MGNACSGCERNLGTTDAVNTDRAKTRQEGASVSASTTYQGYPMSPNGHHMGMNPNAPYYNNYGNNVNPNMPAMTNQGSYSSYGYQPVPLYKSGSNPYSNPMPMQTQPHPQHQPPHSQPHPHSQAQSQTAEHPYVTGGSKRSSNASHHSMGKVPYRGNTNAGSDTDTENEALTDDDKKKAIERKITADNSEKMTDHQLESTTKIITSDDEVEDADVENNGTSPKEGKNEAGASKSNDGNNDGNSKNSKKSKKDKKKKKKKQSKKDKKKKEKEAAAVAAAVAAHEDEDSQSKSSSGSDEEDDETSLPGQKPVANSQASVAQMQAMLAGYKAGAGVAAPMRYGMMPQNAMMYPANAGRGYAGGVAAYRPPAQQHGNPVPGYNVQHAQATQGGNHSPQMQSQQAPQSAQIDA